MHGGRGCRCGRDPVQRRSRDGGADSRSLLVVCVQVQAKECTVAAMLILRLGICLSKVRAVGLLKFNRSGLVLELVPWEISLNR